MSPIKDHYGISAIADTVKSDDKAFQKEFDKILDKQAKKRQRELKLSRQIEKNINYQSFAQGK
jgi:hypothetical protein